MQEIITINNEDFGWQNIKNEFCEIWFKGHNYNLSLQELPFKIKKYDQQGIKKLLSELDGNFSFIYTDQNIICASVDKIGSIPIFYFTRNNHVFISPKTYLLDHFIDFKNIDEISYLAIKMSGYSIGNNTLYKNLKKLNCGEFLYFDKHKKKLEFINYYDYIPLALELDDTEYNYKKKFLDLTFNIFSKLHNYSKQKNKKIAISMSAGLDTRLIVSSLKELGAKNLIGFSYGLKNNSEANAAKKLCDFLDIPWQFSEFTNNKLAKVISSKEFKNFRKKSDTYYSTSDYSDFFAIKDLYENNYLENSIIVNGHSGDFIAGGHMLSDLYKNKFKDNFYKNGAQAIIEKHFRLWKNLATKQNDEIVEKSLIERMKLLNINLDHEKKIFGIIENIQLQERQSKHCLSRQRNYENFGLSWALPLWDNDYLEFWKKIPFELKLNRKFYKETLIQKDIAKVWKGKNWINLNKNIKLNPWYIRSIRSIAKIFFIFSIKKWKLFDKKFFFYWIDNFCGYANINYSKVIFSKNEFRNSFSWQTSSYIKKIMNSDS